MGKKIRNMLTLFIRKEKKGDLEAGAGGWGSVKKADSTYLDILFNSQEAADRRKGSGVNFSPFI